MKVEDYFSKTNKTALLEQKIKFTAIAFYQGAKISFFSPDTLFAGAAIGLYQGLKYNGNLKRGITAGLTTCAVIAGITGITTVAENMKKINEFAEKGVNKKSGT